MQMLIEQLLKHLDRFPNDMSLYDRRLYDGYLNAISMAKELLESEKQQIVDAYDAKLEKLKQIDLPNNAGIEITFMNGETYYNNLINKEK